MRALARFAFAILAVGLISGACFAAPKITGKWKGHVQIDPTKIPKNLDPQRQQILDRQLKRVRSVVIVMIVNKDNTYTTVATGGPLKGAQGDTGTWTLVGNAFTVKPKMNDSKHHGQSQVLVLSEDGKFLTGKSPGGSIVFTRG